MISFCLAVILLHACVLYVHYMHPVRAWCMLCLIYLLAVQRRMQPSRDTVYFVVYAGLVWLLYGCHAEINIDTSFSFYF